jgi:hypothetical protein
MRFINQLITGGHHLVAMADLCYRWRIIAMNSYSGWQFWLIQRIMIEWIYVSTMIESRFRIMTIVDDLWIKTKSRIKTNKHESNITSMNQDSEWLIVDDLYWFMKIVIDSESNLVFINQATIVNRIRMSITVYLSNNRIYEKILVIWLFIEFYNGNWSLSICDVTSIHGMITNNDSRWTHELVPMNGYVCLSNLGKL